MDVVVVCTIWVVVLVAAWVVMETGTRRGNLYEYRFKYRKSGNETVLVALQRRRNYGVFWKTVNKKHVLPDETVSGTEYKLKKLEMIRLENKKTTSKPFTL